MWYIVWHLYPWKKNSFSNILACFGTPSSEICGKTICLLSSSYNSLFSFSKQRVKISHFVYITRDFFFSPFLQHLYCCTENLVGLRGSYLSTWFKTRIRLTCGTERDKVTSTNTWMLVFHFYFSHMSFSHRQLISSNALVCGSNIRSSTWC